MYVVLNVVTECASAPSPTLRHNGDDAFGPAPIVRSQFPSSVCMIMSGKACAFVQPPVSKAAATCARPRSSSRCWMSEPMKGAGPAFAAALVEGSAPKAVLASETRAPWSTAPAAATTMRGPV